jgi:hypothetical protein
MDDDLKRRIGRNEASFRDVNEGIARGRWPGEQDDPSGFRCECGRLWCNELIDLTPREYQRIRANDHWFAVLPGHEMPEVETVIETHDDYVVVEKRDEAARAADAAQERGD